MSLTTERWLLSAYALPAKTIPASCVCKRLFTRSMRSRTGRLELKKMLGGASVRTVRTMHDRSAGYKVLT